MRRSAISAAARRAAVAAVLAVVPAAVVFLQQIDEASGCLISQELLRIRIVWDTYLWHNVGGELLLLGRACVTFCTQLDAQHQHDQHDENANAGRGADDDGQEGNIVCKRTTRPLKYCVTIERSSL